VIIYSCITNGYDVIPEDNYYDPDVRYVMFHDGTVERKGPWEFIDIRDYYYSECPVKTALYPKILPHKFFAFGEDTVWVDGCYKLVEETTKVAKTLFPFTILRHPARHTYYDEILEGFLCEFFSYDDAIFATKYYYDLGYNFKDEIPCCASIWRTISPTMSKFCDDWWTYYECTNIRDQIGMRVSIQLNELVPNIIERDRCGIPMGRYNKHNRMKKRPHYGASDQAVNKNDLLSEMKKYVKMNTLLYARNQHEDMMSRNL